MSNKENIKKAKEVAAEINFLKEKIKNFGDFASKTVNNDEQYCIYFGANKIKEEEAVVPAKPEVPKSLIILTDTKGNAVPMELDKVPSSLKKMLGFSTPAPAILEKVKDDISSDIQINGGEMLQIAVFVKKMFQTKLVILEKEYKILMRKIPKNELVKDILISTIYEE
jgi:hypothetical protein